MNHEQQHSTTTNDLQLLMAEVEGLLSMALHCLQEAPSNRLLITGIEQALIEASGKVHRTNIALDSVNVHRIEGFAKPTKEKAT